MSYSENNVSFFFKRLNKQINKRNKTITFTVKNNFVINKNFYLTNRPGNEVSEGDNIVSPNHIVGDSGIFKSFLRDVKKDIKNKEIINIWIYDDQGSIYQFTVNNIKIVSFTNNGTKKQKYKFICQNIASKKFKNLARGYFTLTG